MSAARHPLDNAATSHPKPDSVVARVVSCLTDLSGSPGRGTGPAASAATAALEDARRVVASFLGARDASRLAFTLNATDSLSLALRSLVRPGARVVTTPLEHASVTRPLERLRRTANVTVVVVEPGTDGRVAADEVARAARDAALVVMTHASNVTGGVQPIEEVAAALASAGTPLLVDAAQSAGPVALDFDALASSRTAVAFTGHKGLAGPMGAGGLLVGGDLEIAAWREGGGGDPLSDEQPGTMPHRLEAGTPPLPSLLGLAAGIAWRTEQGPDTVRERERDLARRASRELESMSGVRIPLPCRWDDAPRAPLVAFSIDGYSPDETALLLEQEWGVSTRAGLHCAPWAHRWLGTWPDGLVRASVGPTTRDEDVAALLQGVARLAARPPR